MLSFTIILFTSVFIQLSWSLCWEQAFVNNTVFIDTTYSGRVVMGYLSQINDEHYPNITATGMPKITPQLLMEKCDKLGVNICAAVQFFTCPGIELLNYLSQDWGNFLTHEEYVKSRLTGNNLYIVIIFHIYDIHDIYMIYKYSFYFI